MTSSDPHPKGWYVYIIEASDQRLYTGISTDVARRWKEHLTGKGGARFFRGRHPSQLRFVEGHHDRASASRREAAIKKLSRPSKLALIADAPSEPLEFWLQRVATVPS